MSISEGRWTQFQIDEEVDAFGVSRIVAEQNRLRAKTDRLESLIGLMKVDIEKYRQVENTNCNTAWIVSRLLWHLDNSGAHNP